MALSRRQLLVGGAIAIPAGALALGRCGGEERAPVSASSRAASASRTREVERLVASQPTIEGAGVHLNRALGGQALNVLDPFLLLDEFQSDDPNDYVAGFPDHPHRGFETVTYMIHGAMEHKDSVGNRGRLGPGSAQWMTAGHGIVHSEMPKQESGLMWGFQLWVNLPAKSKLIRPRYQDIRPESIPEIERDHARIRVVAGKAFDVEGPVQGIAVDPMFLDLALTKGAAVDHPLAPDHTAFLYVTDGAVRVGDARREVRKGQLAVLTKGERFSATCDASSARVIVLAGRPLGEPVSRRGPFVINTDDEIRQAYEDYRSGHLTDGV